MSAPEIGIGASTMRPPSLSDDDNRDLAFKQHILSFGWWTFVIEFGVY
jgi:hypothetical protein